MKTIGLIGGMSYESTIPYYQIINDETNKALGGLNCAKIILWNVNFAELEELMRQDKWDEIAQILGDAAAKLEKAGADLILICTNTMHKLYDRISGHVQIPLIHIAQAAACELKEKGFFKAGLLGTVFTMTGDFYKSVLQKNGIETIVPAEQQMQEINRIIFEELCKGIIKESSREYLYEVIESLKDKGAQAVILGCTELGLSVNADKSAIPSFDTTVIHAKAAVKAAL